MLLRGGIFLSPLLKTNSNRLKAAAPALSHQFLIGGIIGSQGTASLKLLPANWLLWGGSCRGLAAGPACSGLVAGERHVRRRWREATMAGGMKVAVSPATDAGPWGWGAGGGGAVRLLLVLSGCLVCGSGTARGSSCQGGWFRGSNIQKSGERPRARPVTLLSGAGLWGERSLVVGEGARVLNQGLGRLGGGALSGEELGAFWWRQEGRPELGE